MNQQINSPAFYQQQQAGATPQPGTPIMSQQPSANQNAQPYQVDLDIQNDALVDPILKSKELYAQFGTALKALLSQLASILNNENKIPTENQYQILGKSIENFYRVCDLFTVNLRAAHEAQLLSNELKSFCRYYAHIGQMDASRNEIPLVSSINIQSQRINDFKGLMQRFLQLNTTINSDNLGSNLNNSSVNGNVGTNGVQI